MLWLVFVRTCTCVCPPCTHQQLKAQQQARIAQLHAEIRTQQQMLHQQDMIGPTGAAMYSPMATGQFY